MLFVRIQREGFYHVKYYCLYLFPLLKQLFYHSLNEADEGSVMRNLLQLSLL